MLPTEFPQIRRLVIQLWPKCENDWTVEMWSVLADQVKKLDVEQATAIIREVRATQGKGWAPNIEVITKRARQALSALPDARVVRFDKPDPNDGKAQAWFGSVRDGAEWHIRNRHLWESDYPPEMAALLCKRFSEMLGGGR